ncbi:MAG: hydrogenase accessory protein HypB, partial [bacterium]
MCTTCGCGSGETKIEGHVHEHRHADGSVHSHAHEHGPDHEHDHPHDDAHEHEHVHADGSRHSHNHRHDGAHAHSHDTLHYGQGPAHSHAPGLSQSQMVSIERGILDKNDAYARGNRRFLSEHGVLALNFVSSPGSGKTTLLVETIQRLAGAVPVAVIEGDLQ